MTTSPWPNNWRIWTLTAGGLGLFSLLIVRLFYLQVVQAEFYSTEAANQRQRSSQLAPHRGVIYASEAHSAELFPLAVNKQVWSVYAVPRDIEDPARAAEELAPGLYSFRERQQMRTTETIRVTGQLASEPAPAKSDDDKKNEIDVMREQLYQKLNQRTDPYEPLLRTYESLDDEFRNFLEEKKIKGLVLEEKESRFYPEDSLAAHLVGYVGWEGEQQVGRYGVEGNFESELTGAAGFLSAERDTAGRYIGIGNRAYEAAQDGANIVLTIDRVVQSYIEEELKIGIEKYGAERGTVIVMHPKTGAILGMATYPTFNPNQYSAIVDPRVQVNPAVSDIFEPGSIMKPAIMAAAIEEGLVEPNTTMVDNGPVRVADYTINTFDGKHLGVQTMTQVLEQSNNIGMVWVGQQLGAETMYDYLRRFGLGEKTGVELQGETNATLPRPAEWDITTVATASFGQGIALTPLQALNAINAIANGGQLMQPFTVKRIQFGSDRTQETEPTPVHQAISPLTAEKLTAMMVSVIENGVGQLARVPGYYLAGKTGTAQVPDERGKYSPDRKIISFVGFGPVEDPQFSILIKLDNPAGLSFASGTAAPMFNNIAEKLLTYYQIPPEYDASQKPPVFKVP